MTAQVFFLPFRPALDANGLVVPGATLTFYQTGTTTYQSIYADSGLVTPLANPLSANSAGVWPTIYLDGTLTYRVVLKDANGAILQDQDPYMASVTDNLNSALSTLASNAAASAGSAQTSATNAATSATGASLSYSSAVAIGYYYPTRAAGAAARPLNSLFTSDETGTLTIYKVISTAPYYQTVQTISTAGGTGTVTSVALSGGTTGLTTSGGPVTTTGTITLAGTLAVANGGTGATTQAGAQAALGLGTMATQAASSVAITGGTASGLTLTSPTVNTPAITNGSVTITSPAANSPAPLGLTQNNITASYTLALTDAASKDIYITGTTAAQTLTIPANASVAIPIEVPILVTNASNQTWTIAITSDTLIWSPSGTAGSRTLAAFGTCTLIKKTATTWWIYGTGLA